MKCPFCGKDHNKVIDTRESEETIRRRRECLNCKRRFTTYERIAQTGLMVIKQDARRESFDRQKLMGGIVKAVSEGRVQAEVARQAFLYEQKLQSGEIVKVCVNKYRASDERSSQDVELHEYKPEATEEQLRRLAQVKAERDANAVQAALSRVRDDAQSGVNIMPAMLQAVRAYATVGEITGVVA